MFPSITGSNSNICSGKKATGFSLVIFSASEWIANKTRQNRAAIVTFNFTHILFFVFFIIFFFMFFKGPPFSVPIRLTAPPVTNAHRFYGLPACIYAENTINSVPSPTFQLLIICSLFPFFVIVIDSKPSLFRICLTSPGEIAPDIHPV